MKSVVIKTVIVIDGEVCGELFSMDCSETMENFGAEYNDEIVDIIVNDEELNPHYR